MSIFEPLVEVWRGGLLESVHHGAVAVLDSNGELKTAFGDIDRQSFPRSAAKLMQATAMVKAGLELPADELALVAASHSGGDVHVQKLQQIFQRFDLDIELLQCTAFLPIGSAERRAYLATGGGPDRKRSDCSGKHAGFLATCKINDWDLNSYLDPNHPLQIAIQTEIANATKTPARTVTVDGCGAPLYSSSLHGLALAFHRAVVAEAGTPARQVADAMRAFPELVAGPDREPTIAMQFLPGVLAKDGADGVFAMAHPQHGAVAFKISDGGVRGVNALVRHYLKAWSQQSDVPGLRDFPVLGGGKPVGEIRVNAAL